MSRLKTLMGFVKRLDEDISVKNFNERKRFQKLIYIAEALGIKLRYNFGWYKFGPYSPELADDGFTAFSLPLKKWSEYTDIPDLSEYEEDIDELKVLLRDVRERLSNLSEADALELVASLLFLRRHAYPPVDNEEEAIGRLSQYKSFSEKQSKTAWNILQQKDLV